MTPMPNDLPALIEFHDARLTRGIQIATDSTVALHFESITTYFELEPDRYSLYSSTGDLTLKGSTQLRVDGSLTDGARVSDLYLFDGDTKVNAEEVGKSRRISSLLLLLDSGTRLAVICTEAQLTLGGGGKRLKDWEGPLGG